MRQQTRIDRGIEVAHEELTGPRRKPGNQAVMIVLTDGLANPEPASTAVRRAQAAKDDGITIFTIGLGKDDELNVVELAQMAQPAGVLLPRAGRRGPAGDLPDDRGRDPVPGGAVLGAAVAVTLGVAGSSYRTRRTARQPAFDRQTCPGPARGRREEVMRMITRIQRLTGRVRRPVTVNNPGRSGTEEGRRHDRACMRCGQAGRRTRTLHGSEVSSAATAAWRAQQQGSHEPKEVE